MSLTITATLAQSGATAYTVQDYFGNVVSSGTVSGTTVTPAAPAGGWKFGWYRLYLTGPSNDATFGHSYGSTNFVVARTNPAIVAPGSVQYADGDWEGQGNDPTMRGWAGMPPGRIDTAVAYMAEPTLSGSQYPAAPAINSVLYKWSYGAAWNKAWILEPGAWTAPVYASGFDPTSTGLAALNDPVKPRYQFAAMTDGSFDRVILPGSGGDYLHIYCKDGTIDGSKVFIAASAGSVSGTKITVATPNSGTVVETYDNQASDAAAQTAINAASAYVRAYSQGGHTPTLPQTATAIGNTTYNGLVKFVAWLYPRGVTRYEGPYNEISLNNTAQGQEATQMMLLFQAAVHAGNAAAKTMGPCTVDISAVTGWPYFLDAGGGAYCDEFSFHDYNLMTNSHLSLGRLKIQRFLNMLTFYGLQTKPLWQTEANNIFTAVVGVHHPRRARHILAHTLLWEQYGLPKERNVPWYDSSHGFWSYPSFIQSADHSLSPEWAMWRVLDEETFGKPYSSKLDFGSIGNQYLLGNIYTGSDSTGTVALIASSHIDNYTVTLTLSGTVPDSLVLVDAFGNTSTVSVTAGRVVVPVDDVPTYIRLPAGCAVASVYRVNGWDPAVASISGKAANWTVGATFVPAIGDDSLETDYSNSVGIYETDTMPSTATITWGSLVSVDRAIVVSGQCYSGRAAFVTFTVDTSADSGSTWTTRQTVTKATPTSFPFVADANGTGCTRETYWDEQWIFDVPLGATYSVNALRVAVTATSWGGEPDAAAVAAGGQGWGNQRFAIQEIFVPSTSLPDGTPTVGKTASFELGTTGATIAISDTGNATAWDAVSGTTPKYDNTVAIVGTQSAKIGPNGASDYLKWNLSNPTDHYGRAYINLGLVSGFPRIINIDVAGGGGGSVTIFPGTGGSNQHFFISDTTGAASVTSATFADPNTWYRLEWHIVHSATVGYVDLRIYDQSGTLMETLHTPHTFNTGTSATAIRFGGNIGTTPYFWLDGLMAGADAWTGA